jgi:hypothetical protein
LDWREWIVGVVVVGKRERVVLLLVVMTTMTMKTTMEKEYLPDKETLPVRV